MKYYYKKMTSEELTKIIKEVFEEKKEPVYYHLSPKAEEELNKAIREEIRNYIEQDKVEIEFNGKNYYYSKEEFNEFTIWQNNMRNLALRFDSKENNE